MFFLYEILQNTFKTIDMLSTDLIVNADVNLKRLRAVQSA